MITMVKCSRCGKDLKLLPYKCRYCGRMFCVDHQLPENHNCEGLKKWKRGKLKKFKKEVTSKHMSFSDVSRPTYDPSKFPVPKWLKDKEGVLLVVIVLIIVALIISYIGLF